MHQVYFYCMLLGIIIPLVTLLFGFVDNCLDFVAIDIFQFDIGCVNIDLLPLSINALCMVY